MKLKNKIALVAGATRGAGRGIAAVLGEHGATVYCTGRSTRGNLADPKRPETIDDTADLVTARGGRGIAVRCDHTDAAQVERLIQDIGPIDIVVNDMWAGGDVAYKKFWDLDVTEGLAMVHRAVSAHLNTSRAVLPSFLKQKRGLLIDITDGDGIFFRHQFYYDLARTIELKAAWNLARELRTHKHITALALTPGFLRSEVVLETLGVTEENWRDAVPKRPEFAESETVFFVGRAVAALAMDPHVKRKAGRVYNAYRLSQEYGFTDVDGRTPNVFKYINEHMPQYRMKPADDVFYDYF